MEGVDPLVDKLSLEGRFKLWRIGVVEGDGGGAEEPLEFVEGICQGVYDGFGDCWGFEVEGFDDELVVLAVVFGVHATDEPGAVEEGHVIVAVLALGRGFVDVPSVLEFEDLGDQGAVPDEIV